jgi:hypothetical protein
MTGPFQLCRFFRCTQISVPCGDASLPHSTEERLRMRRTDAFPSTLEIESKEVGSNREWIYRFRSHPGDPGDTKSGHVWAPSPVWHLRRRSGRIPALPYQTASGVAAAAEVARRAVRAFAHLRFLFPTIARSCLTPQQANCGGNALPRFPQPKGIDQCPSRAAANAVLPAKG